MAIHTDPAGLEAGFVAVRARDGEIPAYRALPEGGGKFPIALVIQEIFGIHDYIQDVCRRLAKLGYFAIAPDLYYRQGDPKKYSNWQDLREKVVNKVPDEQVMSDLDSAAAYAAGTGKGDGARLYVTGFCWGGRMVWFYAAHNPKVKAAVAWYGRLAGDRDSLHPKNPAEVVGELNCPVLGLYGGLDKSIPQDQVEAMRAKGAEIIVYPDADHGFHADYRPMYNPAAAEDGWRRMLERFR